VLSQRKVCRLYCHVTNELKDKCSKNQMDIHMNPIVEPRLTLAKVKVKARVFHSSLLGSSADAGRGVTTGSRNVPICLGAPGKTTNTQDILS